MSQTLFLEEAGLMCRLYEKFIPEYYRREFPQFCANPDQIPWQLDDGVNDMLPIMQTDITLSNGIKTLIIDAKYYEAMTQSMSIQSSLRENWFHVLSCTAIRRQLNSKRDFRSE